MMKRSSDTSLDVYDYMEGKEVAESVSIQWKFKKRKNPKLDHSSSDEYQMLECFANGAKLRLRRSSNVKDETIGEGGHCSCDTHTPNPLDMPSEGSALEGVAGLQDISGTSFVQCCTPNDDRIRVASKDPSTETFHTSSTSSDTQTGDDGSSDVSDSIQESFPCAPDSVLRENDGMSPASLIIGSISFISLFAYSCLFVLVPDMTYIISLGPVDGEDRDHCCHDFAMLDMDTTVVLPADYVAYRDKYYPASLLIFSESSIKMKDSIYQEVDTYLYSWDVGDIINIHCQWSSRSKLATVRVNLLSKDALQAENLNGFSGIEELEFVVYDPDWYKKQEMIVSLHQKYEGAWNNTFDFHGESNGYVLSNNWREPYSGPYLPEFHEPFEDFIYPEGDIDAVSISIRDVHLLQPETFINDTIIDFYIKYLKNKIPFEQRQLYHFFNSFFFRKLADLDKNPSSAFDSNAAFQRVRKWTRKINLFEKDYIFIPVNYNLHWSLIVICHADEVVNFKDEDMNRTSKVPCILHMDSIRGFHSGLKDLIQRYLWEEWKDRHKDTSEDNSSAFLNLRFISLELPQQENCYDCGLFLLHYVELFLAEAPKNFSPFQITKLSYFLNLNWFMPAEVSLKRAHIQRLIYELLQNLSHRNAPKSCTDELHTSDVPDHGKGFISGICSAVNLCIENSFFSQNQMDEIDMSGGSLSGTSQFLGEPGLPPVESENSPGSNFAQNQNYDLRTHYARSMGALPTIEEEVEVNGDVLYSSGDNGAALSCSPVQFPLEGWQPVVSDVSSSETEDSESSSSSYESDDSDESESETEDSESFSGSESDDSEEVIVLEDHPNSSTDHKNGFPDPVEYSYDSSLPSDYDLDRSEMNSDKHGSGNASVVCETEKLDQSQCPSRENISAHLECDDDSSNVPDHCLADSEMKSVEDLRGKSTFACQKDDLDLPPLVQWGDDAFAIPKSVFDNSTAGLARESSKDEVLEHKLGSTDNARCSSELSVQIDPGSSAIPISSSEVKVVEKSSPGDNLDQLKGKTINSVAESFGSASLEMLGQELDKMNCSADQEPPIEEPMLQPSHICVAENSSSYPDEKQPTGRTLPVSPAHGGGSPMRTESGGVMLQDCELDPEDITWW